MPLKIITYIRTNTPIQPVTEHLWNVGDAPFRWIEDIRWIEADGGELKYIRNLFTPYIKTDFSGESQISVPMPRHKNKVSWYGDMAKTIVANL